MTQRFVRCAAAAPALVVASLLLAGALLGVAARAVHAETAPHWRYSGTGGPAKWGDMAPEFATCKTGKTQSPIDIKNAVPADLPAIAFAYRPSPLKIVDNGHTIQVNVAPGGRIIVGDKTYELVQFHFHKPSEEKIDGKAAAMVVHLVHRDAEGKLAVVGVLLKQGKEHPLIATLWKNLPKDKQAERTVDSVTIDPAALLPEDRGYYTFTGSLTTPPCTEGVTWYVMKMPVELSAEQIARFGKLYRRNARPVQPMNDRILQVTKDR